MQAASDASSSDQFVQQNISDVIARLAALDAAVDADAAGPSSSQQASGLLSEESSDAAGLHALYKSSTASFALTRFHSLSAPVDASVAHFPS